MESIARRQGSLNKVNRFKDTAVMKIKVRTEKIKNKQKKHKVVSVYKSKVKVVGRCSNMSSLNFAKIPLFSLNSSYTKTVLT